MRSRPRSLRHQQLREKIAKLGDEMRRLADLEARMLESPDQQVSLTDPDARSMATSGRGSGVVGYNVQAAVETEHHLIVAHEVTNVGSDRSQLATWQRKRRPFSARRGSMPSPIVATSTVRRFWPARRRRSRDAA